MKSERKRARIITKKKWIYYVYAASYRKRLLRLETKVDSDTTEEKFEPSSCTHRSHCWGSQRVNCLTMELYLVDGS
jgi:hypothetical protein